MYNPNYSQSQDMDSAIAFSVLAICVFLIISLLEWVLLNKRDPGEPLFKKRNR